MRTFLVSVAYLAIGAAAWLGTTCSSGCVVFGLAPVLWLDRHVFRLLPWQTAKPLGPALLLRLGYVVAGMAAAALPVYPSVTLAEALFWGITISLAGFLLELLFGWVAGSSRRRLALSVTGLILLFVFLSPLLNFHPVHTVALQTPAEVGLAYEDVVFEAEDGLRLSGWLVPHPQPRGGIIVCHGLNGNRSHFLADLNFFHDLGLTVLAFDFRGHGRSEGHTITFGHREVCDLVAAEAFLAARQPGLPILLFGKSYGAAVSLQALPRLKHVEGAWIESPFGRFTEISETRFDYLSPALRKGLIRTYTLLVWLDCGFWATDVNPIDCTARVPVVISHGTKDCFIPFTDGQAVYDAYPGPKSYFWVKDATHIDTSTKEPAEHRRRVREFFNDCLPAVNR